MLRAQAASPEREKEYRQNAAVGARCAPDVRLPLLFLSGALSRLPLQKRISLSECGMHSPHLTAGGPVQSLSAGPL